MKLPEDGHMLRIFIGESDSYQGKPLHQWLVQQAQTQGLAGATVLRGIMGFGRSSLVHTAKILRLSQDLPIVVELVDGREKLENYLNQVEHAIHDGLATMEKVQVRFYRGGQRQK